MYWILAAIFLLITLVVPRLRPFGVVGLVILVALLGWAMVERLRDSDAPPRDRPQRGQPASPAPVVGSVPVDVAPELVRIEGLELSGSGAPFELRGRIVNESRDVELRSVTIRVTRRDCYEGALDPSGCVVLWQNRQWTPLVVPPQQAREFFTSMWMHGSAPRPRGEVRDSFELVAATGEAAAADEQPGD